MFRNNKEDNSQYYTGLGEGKATAFTLIKEVIDRHANEDPKAVMIAVKTICDYELLSSPYSKDVVLFKKKAKEL